MNSKRDEMYEMRDDLMETLEWNFAGNVTVFYKRELGIIMNRTWYLAVAEIRSLSEACWFCGEAYCKGHSESELKADAMEWE